MHTPFEPLEPLEDRAGAVIDLWVSKTDESDLESRTGVQSVVHIDYRLADHFERTYTPCRTETAAVTFAGGHSRPGGPVQIGGHGGEKDLSQPVDELRGQPSRVEPRDHRLLNGAKCQMSISFRNRSYEVTDKTPVILDESRCDDEIESRKSVPRRSVRAAHRGLDTLRRELQAGVLRNFAEKLHERGRLEEVELEVLSAAADSRQHLLRVCRGQHEHDVRGWLLESLQ